MIIKIGDRGDDPRGLVAYLGGPGILDEHINPHIVAASITSAGALDKELQDQAVADLRVNQRMWPDVQIKGGHVWHSTLAVGKTEGRLPDQKWRDISRDYVHGMGFEDTNWISVNHGPSAKGNDHVHVVASLVKDNGTKASVWKERYRSQKLAVDLEDKYGLDPLPGRRLGQAQRPDSQKDLARARDQGLPESRRQQIERTVRASASVVADVDAFKKILKANGLEFHPYPEEGGPCTGYSVSLAETRRKDGVVHCWAGGKLARDLSLPRLQLVWKSNTSTRTTHIRAVQELQDLQRRLPVADPLALEDASHQLAGALAAASLATENPPGELAAASKQAGAYAQTVRGNLRPKPPALGVGMLLLLATDPGGPVGKTVMIMQLMAAFRALMDAQFAKRGLVTTRERTPSMAGQAGPDEEMVEIGVTTGITTGALLLERHARKQEARTKAGAGGAEKKDPALWDAKDIRRFRQEDKASREAQQIATRPVGPMVSNDQIAHAQELAEHFDMPSIVDVAATMTERQAALYLADMQSKVVNSVPAQAAPNQDIRTIEQATAFEDSLIAKHGDKVPAQAQTASLGNPSTWKTGDQPATPLQVLWLTGKGGLSEAEAKKMTKAGASSYRTSKENADKLTPPPRAQKPPPRAPGGRSI